MELFIAYKVKGQVFFSHTYSANDDGYSKGLNYFSSEEYQTNIKRLVALLKSFPEIEVKINIDKILKDDIIKDILVQCVTIPYFRKDIYDALTVYIKDTYIIIATRHPNSFNKYKTSDIYYKQLYSELYKGQELYEGGDIYQGSLLKGKKDGFGTMIYATPRRLLLTQATGKTYANGDVYEGNWKDDKKDGKGKMTYANGKKITTVNTNKQIEITYAMGDVYDGEWVDNKKQGKGRMTYANGDVYDGEWVDDKKHGKGNMTFKNGKRFIIDDSKKSTFYKQNTGNPDDIYDGDWKDDKMNGKGKFTKSQGPGLYISHKGQLLIPYRNKWTVEGDFVDNMATYGTMIDGSNTYKDRHFVQTDILTLEKPPEVIPVAIKATTNTKGTNENTQFGEYLKRRNEADEDMRNKDRQNEEATHVIYDKVRNREMPNNSTSPFSTTGVGSV